MSLHLDILPRRTRGRPRKTVVASETTAPTARPKRANDNDEPKTPKKFTKCESTTLEVLCLPSPTKHKCDIDIDNVNVTPPKLRKGNENTLIKTPSTLLNNLSLVSPNKGTSAVAINLFNTSRYHVARRSLHSKVPQNLPGREKELEELHTFIDGLVTTKGSGSLYISGPPGTGKTAALSIILDQMNDFKKIFINCTAIKSSGAIYSRILSELGLKLQGKSEKDHIATIDAYLIRNHKMILLILDEIDQLDSKNQTILYTIFEWPAKKNSKLILIGIANSLDLTDRILPRLQARCELKPKLMHFAPYTKQQIEVIFNERLKDSEVFSPLAVKMLAGKVASVSGDIRRALDIGRRVVELAEQTDKKTVLQSVENMDFNKSKASTTVDIKQVANILNNVYGTSQNLGDDSDDSFPLQQKLIICTLLLILKNSKNKDITIGRLHEVYRRVCKTRNISVLDQGEFVGLCSLVENRGIIRVIGKKDPRLHRVMLQWDEDEVNSALKDRQLLSMVLQDVRCLGRS